MKKASPIISVLTQRDAERFWGNVHKCGADDCWAYRAYDGDAAVYVRNNVYQAHRIAWCLHHQAEIPSGHTVRHSCKGGSCVNPAHLCLRRYYRPGPRPKLREDRFWEKVRRTTDATECWEWIAAVDKSGYGEFGHGGGPGWKKAHRVAFAMEKHLIPPGMQVLHKCDNRRCVNPNHLFLGTAADNVRDMVVKGRNGWDRSMGAAKWNAKMTDEKVAVLRLAAEHGVLLSDLARYYGISRTQAMRIADGTSWKHV